MQLPASKLVERFHPLLGADQPDMSSAQIPCYGAKGNVEADIHETSGGASAPYQDTAAGAYTSARVDVLNVGVLAPQLVPARRRINAVRSRYVFFGR